MAYKTSHRLSMVGSNTKEVIVDKYIISKVEMYIDDYEDISWIISEGLNEWGEDDRSFTDSEINMKNLSEEFPTLIFKLEYDPIQDYSIGERTEYWLDGKYQIEYAEIKVNEFDLNKLKEVD